MEKAVELYEYYKAKGDVRVQNWFGMHTPHFTAISLIVYVVSLIIIKIVMKNREPFQLKWFLILYNLFQVVASFYIFYEILTISIASRYSLTCQTVDYSNNPRALRMASFVWCYYAIKIVDLIDTIIFALRKKSNQITFLHVFHHFSMVANSWFGANFVPGGQIFLTCLLNSFVHGVMYSYYGLAALGPHMQKYLWWKKYLTQLQLIQFSILVLHSLVNLMNTECPFPKGYSLSIVLYCLFITPLFLIFYKNSYKPAAKKSKTN